MSEQGPEDGAHKPDRIVHKNKAKKHKKSAKRPNQIMIKSGKKKSDKPSFSEHLFILLYKNLYILGITIIRRRRRFWRKTRRFFSKLKNRIKTGFVQLGSGIRRGFQNFWRKFKAPFSRIRHTYQSELSTIRKARYDGKFPFHSYKEIIKQVFHMIFRVLGTVFNYVAPFAAIFVMTLALGKYMNRPMGLRINYQNVDIGLIEKEADFSTALQEVKKRIVIPDDTVGDDVQISFLPKYTLVELGPGEVYTESEELVENIILASSSTIEPAFGVYIGGELLGAVTEKDRVLEEFDTVKQNSMVGFPNEEEPEFLKNVSVKSGLYPYSTIKPTQEIIDLIHSDETVDEVYTVVAGDTPSGVADKLNVPYAKLKQLNPTIDSSDFMPGMEIFTAKASPYLQIKNIFTDVYLEGVKYEVEETENGLYPKSFRNVEEEGANGLQQVSARVVYVNGVEIQRDELTRQSVIAPKTERVTIGVEQIAVATARPSTSTGTTTPVTPTTKPPESAVPIPSGKQFIWPTSGGYISMPIWGYHNHTGTDIAGNGGVGSPIYASASGTIITAKRGYTGYGHYLVIDHGGGFKTLYAHCNDLYASVGDYVSQGQVIATSGRTGRVTGPHLHFEIIYGSQYLDARKYIGYG